MVVILRKDARDRGLVRYFTGVECKNGHISERNTKQGTCLACGRMWKNKEFWESHEKLSQRGKENYKKHRATILNNRNAKRTANLEEHRAKQNEWYAKNQQKIRKRRSALYFQNPEKIIEANKGYAKANPQIGRIRSLNRRARLSGGRVTASEVAALLKEQNYVCACGCGKDIKGEFHRDHIIPLVRGGENTIQNIQLLAPRCNLRKHAKDPVVWAESLRLNKVEA
jgi:5-methylcytosine-specific restriction endonuclease McrA